MIMLNTVTCYVIMTIPYRIRHFCQMFGFTKVHINNPYTRQNSCWFGIRDVHIDDGVPKYDHIGFSPLVPGHYHAQLDNYVNSLVLRPVVHVSN